MNFSIFLSARLINSNSPEEIPAVLTQRLLIKLQVRLAGGRITDGGT